MKLISSQALDKDFPLSPGSLCKAKYRVFTRREGPDGHKGRFIWLDILKFNAWAASKGYKYRLSVDHPLAVEVAA